MSVRVRSILILRKQNGTLEAFFCEPMGKIKGYAESLKGDELTPQYYINIRGRTVLRTGG